MDNRVFNVNGKGLDMLTDVLSLAFQQAGRNTKTVGYIFDPDFGLVLLGFLTEISKKSPEVQKFMAPLSAETVAPMVMEWLSGEQAKSITLRDWDRDCSHDGHNTKGWRVFCGDWGHVGGWSSAIVAITPAFMWHGK